MTNKKPLSEIMEDRKFCDYCGASPKFCKCNNKIKWAVWEETIREDVAEAISNCIKRLRKVGSDGGEGFKIIGVENAIYELKEEFGSFNQSRINEGAEDMDENIKRGYYQNQSQENKNTHKISDLSGTCLDKTGGTGSPDNQSLSSVEKLDEMPDYETTGKDTSNLCECGHEIIGEFDLFHSNRRNGKGIITNPKKECNFCDCLEPKKFKPIGSNKGRKKK